MPYPYTFFEKWLEHICLRRERFLNVLVKKAFPQMLK